MAIMKNGPLGQMSGKVGNVVVYAMKDKMVMRSMSSKRKSKAAGKEKASQELFKQVMLTVKQAKDFVRIGFAGQGGHSPYHRALSVNMNRMVAANGFNYSELLFSIGDLAGATDVKASITGNELKVSWEGSTPGKTGNPNDRAMLLVLNTTRQIAEFKTTADNRVNNSAAMTLGGALEGDHPEIYLSFVSPLKWIKNHNPVSDSIWVGSLIAKGE